MTLNNSVDFDFPFGTCIASLTLFPLKRMGGCGLQAISLFHQEFHFGTLENEVPWPLDAWLKAWFEGVTVYGSWFESLRGWFQVLHPPLAYLQHRCTPRTRWF